MKVKQKCSFSCKTRLSINALHYFKFKYIECFDNILITYNYGLYILEHMRFLCVNLIQTAFLKNFVRLGGGAETARALCLFISQQLLALELSFKFV